MVAVGSLPRPPARLFQFRAQIDRRGSPRGSLGYLLRSLRDHISDGHLAISLSEYEGA